MSRLDAAFARLKAANEKALIAFITSGDPDADKTVEIATALREAGVDALELGAPFSDPLADGPSIQASSQRALDAGMTVRGTLEVARRIREQNPDLPLIVMTYVNPILRYGLADYARDAKAAGIDAHIVTDLTPEEADEWKSISEQNGLDTVFLLAPTSTDDRIEVVTKLSKGFVYCVSRTGVTGARQDVPAELTDVIANIKRRTDLPVCVGFGVSEPAHVEKIARFADGVIVGSALVNLIHQNRDHPNVAKLAGDYIATLKAATK